MKGMRWHVVPGASLSAFPPQRSPITLSKARHPRRHAVWIVRVLVHGRIAWAVGLGGIEPHLSCCYQNGTSLTPRGPETKPNYFEEPGERINDKCHRDRIEVRVEGAGMDTLSLFDFAKALADAEPDGYTHVWVVYDKDSFPASDFDSAAARCERESSQSQTFHAAWTNEAFELWYILHFEYLEAALSRNMYEKILTTHLSAV